MSPHRVLFLTVLLGFGSWCWGQEYPSAKGAKETPALKVKVVVRFSVTELDPQAPGDSFVECTVRNDSAKAVRVPTVYNAGFDRDMILKGDGVKSRGWGLWLVYWNEKMPKQRLEQVEPGKELTVFKAPLASVLLLQADAKNPATWTWEA